MRAIGKLNPSAATAGVCGAGSGDCVGVTEYAIPALPPGCPSTHVSGIAINKPAGIVWFDDSLASQVGSFDKATGAFALYNLSACGNHPHDGLGLDASARPWWDEEFVNAIGKLLP